MMNKRDIQYRDITQRFNSYMKYEWANNYIEFLCFLNRMNIGESICVNGMYRDIPQEWIEKFKLNVQESKYFTIENKTQVVQDMSAKYTYTYQKITKN